MTTRRLELALFLLLWISFAWFHHSAPGWNVNSRLALTYAIVEQGTVRIDDYVHVPPQDPRRELLGRGPIETGDAAMAGGSLYSDKIIGTSLLGIPAFAAVRGVEAMRGRPLSLDTRRWVVTALSVGLLGAAAGVLLFRLLVLMGGATARGTGVAIDTRVRTGVPWGPLLITVLTMLGTQLWFYATLFMSYLPSAFLLLWGLLRFQKWVENSALSPAEEPHTRPPLFSCGLLMGAAVLCEYLAGIAAVLFLVYAVSVLSGQARIRSLVFASTRYGAGFLLGLMPFIVYTLVVFGRISVPYDFHVDPRFRSFMSHGLMGATFPDWNVLVLITVHPFRGLFVHSPWLLAGVTGLGIMIRNGRLRRLGLLGAGVVVLQLLYNSAYYMWWGGWSFGPRHLIPALPFLALGAGEAWRRSGTAARGAIGVLGAAAVALHLIVNSVDPQVRDLYLDRTSPFLMTLPRLLEPSLVEYAYPWVFPRGIWPVFAGGHSDANLGTLAGLPHGWPSVLPLVILWAGSAGGVWWRGRGMGSGKGH